MEARHYWSYLDRLEDLSSQMMDLGAQAADLCAEMRADPPSFRRTHILGVAVDVPTNQCARRV